MEFSDMKSGRTRQVLAINQQSSIEQTRLQFSLEVQVPISSVLTDLAVDFSIREVLLIRVSFGQGRAFYLLCHSS
jgi:hypothetical protein